jgi:hypothetical protein
MTLEIIEIEGKAFVPADQLPIPEWNSVLSERPQPILTLKDDDLFLLTDTLGNIGGSVGEDRSAGMGLFCKDTRFLSRLELQIEGRSPILLSSTADKGFVLSVLCTNPHIDDRIKAESIGIKRELVLNGGLFEEIEISNYSTSAATFELSLSFDADFIDLFEVRGFGREKRGRLLRLLPPQEEQTKSWEKEFAEGMEEAEKADYETDFSLNPPPPAELILAYQGLDEALLEARIQFAHRQPDFFKGNTAIWHLHLESHATQTLGYRLQMLNNGRSASTVSAPSTLAHAKAAELMEEQTWRQQ